MDTAEAQALKDLAQLFVDKELGPLLTDLISKLPATYGPIVGMIESAVLPAVVAALETEIQKIQ